MRIYSPWAEALGMAAALLASAPPARAAEPEVVVEFDPSLGELPESIAADDAGNLFVSMGNRVVQVDAGLQVTTLASLPVPEGVFATGVKFGPDGSLYVTSAAFDPSLGGSFVWRISPQGGEVELVATLDPNGFPNDMAFQPDGTIYVTDSFLGSIWKVEPDGTAAVWLSDPALEGDPANPALGNQFFGADGIAFDRVDRFLYVTNLDFGTILKVCVLPDGTAGTLSTFAQDERLVGADGIAFDVAGRLFVAVNAQDRIATVNRFGGVRVVSEGAPLDGPSSVAFGASGADRRTLYVSNFAISRATGEQPGDPHPSIARLEVLVPGLPLP